MRVRKRWKIQGRGVVKMICLYTEILKEARGLFEILSKVSKAYIICLFKFVYTKIIVTSFSHAIRAHAPPL